jgi:hypothetical protein
MCTCILTSSDVAIITLNVRAGLRAPVVVRQTLCSAAGCSVLGEEFQQQGVDLLGLFLLDPVTAVVQHDRGAGLGRVCAEFAGRPWPGRG